MDCKKDAKIVYGFKKGVTAENLKDAIENAEENVKYVNVRKGDFISIPSGTVHAVMEGIMLCEVQQSSDVTYRVYDWNRVDKDGKPRELHKQKALDVISLNNNNKIYNYNNMTSSTSMYKSDLFNIDMIKIDGQVEEKSNKDSFYAYIVIEGSGNLKADNYYKKIEKGSTFLIPASLGNYTIIGNMKLIKIWV